MLTQAGRGVAGHPDLCEFFRQTSVEAVCPWRYRASTRCVQALASGMPRDL